MLATAIPIINFFIVPSAVAGATALSVEQFQIAIKNDPKPV
jgi:uncharacterized protein involved in cysteine biosynthesis